jgi:uncharacterized protein
LTPLDAARTFYGTTLGCAEGRSSAHWIDFDLFGHQIVAHLKSASENGASKAHQNPVDGMTFPFPTSASSFQWKPGRRWRIVSVASASLSSLNLSFASKARWASRQPCFFLDPAGNALEFKAFADITQLFAK